MKKDEIKIGGTYLAKVSGNVVPVRIDAENPHGGWDATNVTTSKPVRIKSAQRLRGAAPSRKSKEHMKAVAQADQENARLRDEREASPDGMTASERAMAESSPRKLSCLDAAVTVLEQAGEPLGCMEMINRMHTAGLWTSDKATPQNTLYAAIAREIKVKGDASRFRKAERGKFQLNA